jgi:diguanylate cyclase (GGDEF)-like protein/PAS domain S-box-containing protein
MVIPVLPMSPLASRVVTTCIEITDKKISEHQLNLIRQRCQAVIENAHDGIITINEKQTIKLMNEAARDIFGITTQSDILGMRLEQLIPLRYQTKHEEYVNTFRHSVVDSRPMHSRAPVYGLRADGTSIPLEVSISKIRVGSEIEMTAVVRDISERSRLLEELSKAATQDPLTGLFNRRFTTRMISKELERCRRFKRLLGIAMFDLDHFKNINDNYGHMFGDDVLRMVSVLLSNNIREVDTFSRWGGEEFVVLLPETNLETAMLWAERARKIIASTPIKTLGRVHKIASGA